MTFGRILPAWFFTLCENSCLGSWFKHAQWLFANATMALDESAHRLFVGCRSGAIVVFDSQSGKELQSVPVGKGVDDLMFDPASKRIYATSGGTGQVDVYQETDPDHYQSLGNIPSGPGAKTGLLVPQLARLFVAVPPKGTTPGEVYVYQVQ